MQEKKRQRQRGKKLILLCSQSKTHHLKREGQNKLYASINVISRTKSVNFIRYQNYITMKNKPHILF